MTVRKTKEAKEVMKEAKAVDAVEKKKASENKVVEKPTEKTAKVVKVEAVDKKVKIYGLITKSYNIGGHKVNIHKDKTLMIPAVILPLLEGLKVVKKI